MLRVKIISFLIFLFFIFSGYSSADIIFLKSGKTIQGEIVEATDNFVKLDLQSRVITYLREEIEDIVYTNDIEGGRKNWRIKDMQEQVRSGNYREVITIAREVIDDDFYSERIHIYAKTVTGISFYHLQNYEDAIDVFGDLETEYPDMAAPVMYMGLIYLKQDKKTAAQEKFRAFLQRLKEQDVNKMLIFLYKELISEVIE